MAFNGKAPEITNGRLAMLGFLAAVAAELATGEQKFHPYRSGQRQPTCGRLQGVDKSRCTM